jgi:RNA polymerase sigma-70 factor (ECF subfamily)
MSTVTTSQVTGRTAQELEQMFREHYQFVYRTAYGLTGNSEDAEDILQNIFAGLVRREFPPDLLRNPKAYFYRAAFNLSMNVIRDRKRRPSAEDDEAISRIPARSEAGEVEEQLDRSLHEAIAALSPGAAQVVLLRYLHDHSIADIAKLLGTTRSTVAVTLFRARARLKKLLVAMETQS